MHSVFFLTENNESQNILFSLFQIQQAGMSGAQPQAEAVSLEQKASFLLKIYIRPVVAEIFHLDLEFKIE